MQINFPSTISGSSMSPRSISYLNNMYDIGGFLVPRKGMNRELLYSAFGVPELTNSQVSRGLMVSADGSKIYGVFGNKIFRVNVQGSLDYYELDTTGGANLAIDGDLNQNVAYATGFTGIAFCTGVSNFFIDTTNDKIEEIIDPDLPACIDVSYIDGRFVWVATAGDFVFYSDVNNASSVNALSFFDAESRPDKNLKSALIGNDLYILGEKSIERFRSTGSSTAPFSRVTNSIVSLGYVGGLIELTDSIVFIGRRDGFGIGIFRLSGSTLSEISNTAVNEMLNEEGSSNIDPAQVVLTKSQSWSEYGKQIISFSFFSSANSSFRGICIYGIESGGQVNWGFLSDNPDNTYPRFKEWGLLGLSAPLETVEADVIYRGFSFVNSVLFDNRYFFQRGYDYGTAGLYSLDYSRSDSRPKTYDAPDEPISYGMRAIIPDPSRKNRTLNSLEVYFNTENFLRESGNLPIGDDNDIINLRVSRTGVGHGYDGGSGVTTNRDWSEPYSQIYGSLPNDGRVMFSPSGGVLASNGHISLILETSSESPITIEGVFLNK